MDRMDDALYDYTFTGNWERVMELYETKPEVQNSTITTSKDTALHMAISDDREEVVEKLVGSIVQNKNKEALKMKNNRSETPLHRAATRKSVTMCVYILRAGQEMDLDLLSFTNERGETPIFTAALYNRKPAFIFLHHAAAKAYPHDPEIPYRFLRRSDTVGDTALHSVIRREHFDLAIHMIYLCPDLMSKCDEKGITPLHVLASKPFAFRSGLSLSWWKKIIYYCVRVDPTNYYPHFTLSTSTKAAEPECLAPDNYRTCCSFFWGCYSALGKFKDYTRGLTKSRQGGMKKGQDPEYPGDPGAPYNSYPNKSIPQNYTTCYELISYVYLTLFRFSGFENVVNKIREEKENHERSVQILKLLIGWLNKEYITEGGYPGSEWLPDFTKENPPTENAQDRKGDSRIGPVLDPRRQNTPTKNAQHQKGKDGDTETPSEENETYTPLLVAAKKGVIEVVNEILSQLPVSIYDTTSKGKNILQVAVENRQPRVIEAVQKQVTKKLNLNLWDDLIGSVDTDENTILHLAAKYELQIEASSALLMQHEIKWYEYVKSFLPHHFTVLTNSEGKTPGEIFLRRHKDLVAKSDEWLSRTSESCSVVAALVAGVSFATSSTVPGGNNDRSGKPTLEGQPGFDIFAAAALIALCFSVTALIMFLSILTSRKQATDFMKKLPVKLFLALSSLFASIISMFVSFCAAHSFVLEDKFKKSVLPLYLIVSLPVYFTIVEFPLYMDLFKGIFMKVPRPNDQIRI